MIGNGSCLSNVMNHFICQFYIIVSSTSLVVGWFVKQNKPLMKLFINLLKNIIKRLNDTSNVTCILILSHIIHIRIFFPHPMISGHSPAIRTSSALGV